VLPEQGGRAELTGSVWINEGGETNMKRAFLAGGARLAVRAGKSPRWRGEIPSRIGFVSTFSGPDRRDRQRHAQFGFELALDHLGRKMGGKPVEGDLRGTTDRRSRMSASRKTEKTGAIRSCGFHRRLHLVKTCCSPRSRRQSISQTFLDLGPTAGPSQLAGDLCSPYLFSTSWQNDQTPSGDGALYMNQKGVKSVFLIGPELCGPARTCWPASRAPFKGEIKGEEYTVWPSQLDFLGRTVRRARASGAASIFVFYPGGCRRASSSINMRRPGLKEQMAALTTAFTIDGIVRCPLQKGQCDSASPGAAGMG